jgi:hypothetical protein
MARRKKRSTSPRRRVADPAGRAFRRAVSSAATGQPRGAQALPGDIQVQVDVHVSLLDAMTDHFPIKRSDVDSDTVPSGRPLETDEGGWGVCLAGFGECLRRVRPVYAFYVHKPRYTTETIDRRFADTVLFLKGRILAQFLGEDK